MTEQHILLYTESIYLCVSTNKTSDFLQLVRLQTSQCCGFFDKMRKYFRFLSLLVLLSDKNPPAGGTACCAI